MFKHLDMLCYVKAIFRTYISRVFYVCVVAGRAGHFTKQFICSFMVVPTHLAQCTLKKKKKVFISNPCSYLSIQQNDVIRDTKNQDTLQTLGFVIRCIPAFHPAPLSASKF